MKWILRSLWLMTMIMLACQQWQPNDLNIYFLHFRGDVTYQPSSVSENEIQGLPLTYPRNLPSSGSIKTAGDSNARLQIGSFLSLTLAENSTLSYSINEANWESNLLFRLGLNLDEGRIDINRSSDGLADQVHILINESYWLREQAVFRLTKITEKKEKSAKIDEYTTIVVQDGGVHYISPITGRVDMYIDKAKSFTVKNRVPRKVISLTEKDLPILELIIENVPRPVGFGDIEAILYREQNLIDSAKHSEYFYLIMTGVVLFILVLLYSLIRFIIYKNYKFRGKLSYWDSSEKVQDIKTVYFSYPEGRSTLYIGKKGYSNIRLSGVSLQKNIVIKGILTRKGCIYKIRHRSHKDLVFIERENPKLLSYGDRFMVGTYVFEFSESARRMGSRRKRLR